MRASFGERWNTLITVGAKEDSLSANDAPNHKCDECNPKHRYQEIRHQPYLHGTKTACTEPVSRYHQQRAVMKEEGPGREMEVSDIFRVEKTGGFSVYVADNNQSDDGFST
jgi:hypothetical protein